MHFFLATNLFENLQEASREGRSPFFKIDLSRSIPEVSKHYEATVSSLRRIIILRVAKSSLKVRTSCVEVHPQSVRFSLVSHELVEYSFVLVAQENTFSSIANSCCCC